MPKTWYRLRCASCHSDQEVDGDALAVRLAELGIGRRSQWDDDTLWELANGTADRLACHHCNRRGLSVSRSDPPIVRDLRRCEECGESISAERLELLPQTRVCVACQGKDEQGDTTVVEYCPRCGDLMQTRLGSGSGTTRYRLFCPNCGR